MEETNVVEVIENDDLDVIDDVEEICEGSPKALKAIGIVAGLCLIGFSGHGIYKRWKKRQQIKSLVRAEMEVEDILDDEASEEAEVSDKDEK